MDAALVISCQFMEFSEGTVHYWIWNDSNTNDSAGDLFEQPASEAIFSHREERVGKSRLLNCQGGMHCNNLASRPIQHKTSFHREWNEELVAHFEKAHVILQYLGAIDGTHIEIK